MPLLDSKKTLEAILESIVPSVIACLISGYHDEMIPIDIIHLPPRTTFAGKIGDDIYTSFASNVRYNRHLYKNNVATNVWLQDDDEYRIMRVKQHLLLIASETRAHVWNTTTNRVVDLETGKQARTWNGYVYYINSANQLYEYDMDTNRYTPKSETNVYQVNVLGQCMSYTCDSNRPYISRGRMTCMGREFIVGECIMYGYNPCLTIWKDFFGYNGYRYHLQDRILDVGLFDHILFVYGEKSTYTCDLEEETLKRIPRPTSTLLRICNDTHLYGVQDNRVYIY